MCDGQTVKADKSQIGIGDKAVLKVSYATNSVCVEGSQAGGDGRVEKVTVVVHKWALVTDTELQVIAVRPPSFRSSTATDPRIKWSTLDSSDLSSDCCASTFSMWRFTSTNFANLTNLKSLKGSVANDQLVPSSGHTRFREGAGPQNRGLGAQIGIPRVRTHPIQTIQFLVKVHRAQDRALLRAANMTEVQLTVEGVEHDVVDVLLEDLTSLRHTFYVRVENVTALAQSTRGSRKAGQDSDDELSAGDLDQDDEE